MTILARFLLAAAALPLLPGRPPPRRYPRASRSRTSCCSGRCRSARATTCSSTTASTYKLTSESKTAGVAALIYRLNITRVSTGAITARGLRPDSYDETRNGKLKRRVRFDWKQKKVELFDGETTQTVDLPDNTWDMASFGYNFAFVPADERSEMDLFLTDGRRVSPYKFAVLGQGEDRHRARRHRTRCT